MKQYVVCLPEKFLGLRLLDWFIWDYSGLEILLLAISPSGNGVGSPSSFHTSIQDEMIPSSAMVLISQLSSTQLTLSRLRVNPREIPIITGPIGLNRAINIENLIVLRLPVP